VYSCYGVTLKCCQLIQRLLAAECWVFGDNSAAEFRRISQIAPRNLAKFDAEKLGPDDKLLYHPDNQYHRTDVVYWREGANDA